MQPLDHHAALMAGLLLGLSSAGLCFWSCAAVMGPFMLSTSDDPAGRPRWSSVPGQLRVLAWYNLGRLVAYAAAALLVAQLAGLQAGLPALPRATLRLLAAAVVGWAVLRPHAASCWSPKGRATGALLLGITQGFSPCPPFLSAVALGLASPPGAALLLFGALFLVTTLFTLPFSLLEPLRRRPWLLMTSRVVGGLVCAFLVISALAPLLLR